MLATTHHKMEEWKKNMQVLAQNTLNKVKVLAMIIMQWKSDIVMTATIDCDLLLYKNVKWHKFGNINRENMSHWCMWDTCGTPNTKTVHLASDYSVWAQ